MDIDTQAVRRILWCDVAIAASHNYVMLGQPAAVADAVLKAYDERFGEVPVVASGAATMEAAEVPVGHAI